nr:ATP-binding protein [uncultured Steroidobacter sp.]
MAALIDDLLDVSRIGAGHLNLNKEVMDLGELLSNLQTSLRASFEAVRQQLIMALPDRPLYVHADRTRLIQVFSNIFQNANKYTPSGGRITVQLRQEQDDVVVSVRDTGLGIPRAMLDRVFELFAQLDRSYARTRGGLGIGLNVAKRLVEAHDGHIEARSEGEGLGSEFIVRTPLFEAPE